jgi:digeranylgeranylglycerophospholipid reductase
MKDIGIIGGGPAGVIAGSYLVKAGFKVTIYEKNERVISTPCGEGISHTAILKLRHDTGFDSAPYFSSSIDGLKNIFPGNYYTFTYEYGYVLEREKWIDGIRRHFEKNGGQVIFNSEIKDVSKLNESVIIGADGPISKVRQKIGGKVDMCTAMQYKMKLDWENHDLLEFYWDLDISDLYGWNFPKKDYFNVGVIGNLKKLDNFCKKYKISGEILKKEGYTIPFNGSKIHEDKYFLVGDSAGMANAFSKGGLAAIVYASDILTYCLKNGFSSSYEQKIRSHPAFSKSYSLAMKTILSLNQKELEIIGKLTHDKDLLNLPTTTKLKALKYPSLLPNLLKIIRAFKGGMKYAW